MPSLLFTTSMTLRPDLRRKSVMVLSCGVRPWRPSTMNITTSASATACFVCSAISCMMPSLATGSKPPVSITRKGRSPMRPFAVVAVARQARQVRHQRVARAGQAVE
jgi:hypothetical protein